MNGLLVCAHPDDETLWGGGFIYRNPGEWTILCLTRPTADPERLDGFLRACNALGARGIAIGADEKGPWVSDRLNVSGFDIVITHNSDGEYGHAHHKAVHAMIGTKATHHFTPPYTLPDEREFVLKALKCYDHCSPMDGGLPKWEALLKRYGALSGLRSG